jgi:hypothetical protein
MDEKSTLLPSDWAIPERLRDRLGTSAGRQRLLEADGHMVLVLHAVPGFHEIGRRGRFFWRSPEGVWKTAPRSDRVGDLDEHVAEYRQAIEQLEHAEDGARLARDYFDLLDRLTPLARAARNMHDVLQQARDAAKNDRHLIVVRDQTYDVLRRAELLRDEARNGLEFAIAWQAEQQAETSYQMSVASHRLNLLVAFFFPVATLMAIFGANLRSGIEGWSGSHAPYGLLTVLGMGLLCGIALTAFVMRPARRPERDTQSKSSSSSTNRSK